MNTIFDAEVVIAYDRLIDNLDALEDHRFPSDDRPLAPDYFWTTEDRYVIRLTGGMVE